MQLDPRLISIVINYFNPDGNSRIRSMIQYCLESYEHGTAYRKELLLVDGSGQVDASLQSLCSDRGWRYLVCPDKGMFARIYNAGARAATGDFIVWSASDIFVCPGWDARLIGEMERTGAWMAAPYLTNSDYTAQIRHWPLRMVTFRPSYMTFNLNMVTRQCVEKVGLMDDRFSGNYNDLDYLVRIRRAGGDAIVVDAGQVLHVARGTSSVSSTFRLDEDLRAFLHKYPEFRTTRRDWPFDVTAAELHRSVVYRFLLRTLGKPGRPLYWLAKLEPLLHAC
jgi:GT2 family glycosyltransferase